MKQYEVFRKDLDPGPRYAHYDRAVEELVSRLPQNLGLGYEYKRRGNDFWFKVASKPKLKQTLLDKSLQVGEAFYARRRRSDAVRTFVLRAVEVQVIPDCPVSDPTPAIKALWDKTYAAFLRLGPGYEFVYMGGYVCRKIDGSASWSQHAFHNAFDFRIRQKDEAAGSIDATATSKVVNAVENEAAEALWLVPGHYFHAHLTGDPKRFGTPACA